MNSLNDSRSANDAPLMIPGRMSGKVIHPAQPEAVLDIPTHAHVREQGEVLEDGTGRAPVRRKIGGVNATDEHPA